MIHRVRKAFVLGAGLGTRLRPLTNMWPKPLLPIFGKSLITFALDHLIDLGIEKVWVNTHHLPEKFAARFPDREYHGISLELVHEPDLLGTGGGIKNLEHRIGNEPFVVYSGDVLTDLPVGRLVDEHFSRRNDVTLALRSTGLSASVHWCPEAARILDFHGVLGSSMPGQFDFAGISVWNPSVFSRLPPNARTSFIPILMDWIQSGGKVGGAVLEDGQWFNVGGRNEYLATHRTIEQQRWVPNYLRGRHWPTHIDSTARVSAESHVDGGSWVGAQCCIEPKVLLENSVVLPASHLSCGVRLKSCIVAGVKVETGIYQEIDFL